MALTEDRTVNLGRVWMSVRRPTVAYGPGDEVVLPVHIRSSRANPVRVQRFEVVLREVITLKGDLRTQAGSGGTTNGRNIFAVRTEGNAVMQSGEEHRFELQAFVPPDHERVSTSTAKHIFVAYHLRVTVYLEETTSPATDDLQPLTIDNLPVTIGNWNVTQSQTITSNIIEANTNRIPAFVDIPPGAIMPRENLAHKQASLPRSRASQDSSSVQPSPIQPGAALSSSKSSHSDSLSWTPPNTEIGGKSDQKVPAGDRVASLMLEDARRRTSMKNSTYTAQTYVTNPDPDSSDSSPIQVEAQSILQPESTDSQLESNGQQSYKSAEEEKATLYANARAKVAASNNQPRGQLPAEYATAAQEKNRNIVLENNASMASRYNAQTSMPTEQAAVSACQFKAPGVD